MKKVLLLGAVLAVFVPLQAQMPTSLAQIGSFSSPLHLPDRVDNLSYYNGKLRFSTGDALYTAMSAEGRVVKTEIDTALLELDRQIDYVVVNPATGNLFYTRKDSKGRTLLFECYEKQPGKTAVRQLRPYKFSYSIEHPVFTADGRVMVFASDCPLGVGGKDLWYSEFRNDEWQYPQNLGIRINTEGEEVMPQMYGEFLIFATNGRRGAQGLDLYATRLIAEEQTGDTVMMLPIGRSDVYPLEAPFCGPDDQYGLTLAADGRSGWFVQRGPDSEELVYFQCALNMVKLTGLVSDAAGKPIANARVAASQNGVQLLETKTDAAGNYYLLLGAGENYDLAIEAADYYSVAKQVRPRRLTESRLYPVDYANVTMQSFEFGQPYRFDDLFSTSVSSELSLAGRNRIQHIAQYLKDNPHIHLTIVSAFRNSSDIAFCTLVNEARLRTLTEYLIAQGVPHVAFSTSTAMPPTVAQDNSAAPSSAAQASSRTVVFTFTK